jgi:hypothetical protein
MTADALAQLIVLTLKSALLPLRTTVAALEAQAGALAAKQAVCDTYALELSALRERLAVLETRAPVAGPAGADGRDGLDGRDGADGVRLEDLAADFDGDRTLTLRFSNGIVQKAIPITLPIPRWQGVYVAGRPYQTGDLVSWQGSAWHCQQPTTSAPNDRARAWRLMVKSGRDYTPRQAPAAAGGA